MEVKRCLIIDTETAGLEDTAPVIEVGAVLYSVEHQSTLLELATLLPGEHNDAETINRIKPAALRDVAFVSTSHALELLFRMSKAADVYVAHNAEFDSKRLYGKTDFLPMASLPWLCTMADFKWPLGREQGSLVNLALDHGIGVASAHRALTDCRLIAALFDRMENLQGDVSNSNAPQGLICRVTEVRRKPVS